MAYIAATLAVNLGAW